METKKDNGVTAAKRETRKRGVSPKGLTLRHIAEEADVSVATVSRVLSGYPDNLSKVNPQSAKGRRVKRVLEICERHRFLPSIHYTRIQQGRSRVIGLLFRLHRPDRTFPFFNDNVGYFIDSLELTFNELGYDVILQGVDEAYEQEKKHLHVLRNRTADGLLIWDAFSNPETLRELAAEGAPVIGVAFPDDHTPFQIIPDNFQGAFDITRHLLGLGHKKIAHIGGGTERVDREREDGYRRAMTGAGLGLHMFQGEYSFQSGYQWTGHILEEHTDITAIFAANDIMAAGCVRRAIEAGLTLPADLAIAGFDGTEIAAISTPPITTARLPLSEMGRMAARRVVDLIEGRPPEQKRVVLPLEILIRESTRGR